MIIIIIIIIIIIEDDVNCGNANLKWKYGHRRGNPTDIANNFCDYFTNIGPNLAS